MKRVKLSWFVVLVSLAVLGFNATGNAAEIIYQDDISQNLVTKDVLVRTADNAIVLMDGSSSMDAIDPKYKKTRYEMAKQALANANMRLPDLGYNIGIYLLAPSWKAIYPVQKFDRAKISEALGQLPAKASGRTSFRGSFEKLEGVLKGLPGKTVVYIFSDGGYLEVPGIDPGNTARELANKYNVCFVVIDYAEDPQGLQQVKDMGRANACTRVIPFNAFISNPYYSTGLLYYSKSGTAVETTTKKKVKTMVVNNIYFDNDKFDLKPQEKNELDQLGKFLQDNPQAFVSLQGFCDSMGSGEFNMDLSRRRAEAVADYLSKNFKLDPGRVVAMWYGEANPVASNGTDEGRAKNRRVEVAVGGL